MIGGLSEHFWSCRQPNTKNLNKEVGVCDGAVVKYSILSGI